MTIERAEKTARVLALLDESFRAHIAGDDDGMQRAAAEACKLDVDCVSVIRGGIMIGEIPNPERDYLAWSDYIAAAVSS